MDIFTNLGVSIWSVVKVAVLFAILIYIVFALVVVKQVNLMTETLELGHEAMIKLLSIGLLLFAIGLFIFVLVVL